MKTKLAKIVVVAYALTCLIGCMSLDSTNEAEESTPSQIPAQHIFVQTIIQTEKGEKGISNQVWRVENKLQTELLFELEGVSNTSLSEVFSIPNSITK